MDLVINLVLALCVGVLSFLAGNKHEAERIKTKCRIELSAKPFAEVVEICKERVA